MDDLQLVIEFAALDPAANDALGALGVRAFQVGSVAAEEHQHHEAGLVIGADLPGLAGAAGALMGVDGDEQGLGLADHRLGDLSLGPSDQRLRRDEQRVAHQRPRDPLQQRLNARPHALQRADGREQGEENLRPHAGYFTPLRARSSSPAPSLSFLELRHQCSSPQLGFWRWQS